MLSPITIPYGTVQVGEETFKASCDVDAFGGIVWYFDENDERVDLLELDPEFITTIYAVMRLMISELPSNETPLSKN